MFHSSLLIYRYVYDYRPHFVGVRSDADHSAFLVQEITSFLYELRKWGVEGEVWRFYYDDTASYGIPLPKLKWSLCCLLGRKVLMLMHYLRLNDKSGKIGAGEVGWCNFELGGFDGYGEMWQFNLVWLVLRKLVRWTINRRSSCRWRWSW